MSDVCHEVELTRTLAHVSYLQTEHCTFYSWQIITAGTPLEISKRRFVVPILYAQSIVWAGQVFFMCKPPLRPILQVFLHPDNGCNSAPWLPLLHLFASWTQMV